MTAAAGVGAPPEGAAPQPSLARGVVRLGGWLFITVLCLLCIPPMVWLRLKMRWRAARIYHAAVCWVLGIQVVQHGRQAPDRPLLIVANHLSSLDIPVLGGLLEGAVFIAKQEVKHWPLFGFLADLQETMYIARDRSQAKQQAVAIAKRLDQGDRLILFPEGTSSTGHRVLPFRSALLAPLVDVAHGGSDRQVPIQPVTVACSRVGGLPAGHALRHSYAWYGDMELPPHLWALCCRGRVRVDVVFHPILQPNAFPSRKALAAACQDAVASGLDRANAGLPPLGDSDGQT